MAGNCLQMGSGFFRFGFRQLEGNVVGRGLTSGRRPAHRDQAAMNGAQLSGTRNAFWIDGGARTRESLIPSRYSRNGSVRMIDGYNRGTLQARAISRFDRDRDTRTRARTDHVPAKQYFALSGVDLSGPAEPAVADEDERTRNLWARSSSQPMPTMINRTLHLSPRCPHPRP